MRYRLNPAYLAIVITFVVVLVVVAWRFTPSSGATTQAVPVVTWTPIPAPTQPAKQTAENVKKYRSTLMARDVSNIVLGSAAPVCGSQRIMSIRWDDNANPGGYPYHVLCGNRDILVTAPTAAP